jgi:hypothetical protein
MRPENYCRRVWLNPGDQSLTGSIVTFNGDSAWKGENGPVKVSFVEVADCHNKVRIHGGDYDSISQFADKVELMRDTLTEFVQYLRKLDGGE